MKFKNILIRCYVFGSLLMCLNSVFIPAYTYGVETTSYIEGGNTVINAEQTQWKYRVVDGKPQKRLWSITYGKWLTDWQWV